MSEFVGDLFEDRAKAVTAFMMSNYHHRVGDHVEPQYGDPALSLSIVALAPAGPGGACDSYLVTAPGCMNAVLLPFQRGPITEENGPNGYTMEALLAIVADRLGDFQAGPFPCDDNQVALGHVQGALAALHARTLDRATRSVEGKLEA